MLKYDDDNDHEDRDVDTKPALDPLEAIRNTLQARLTNLKNHNCKGMSLQLNKQLLIQPYI